MTISYYSLSLFEISTCMNYETFSHIERTNFKFKLVEQNRVSTCMLRAHDIDNQNNRTP